MKTYACKFSFNGAKCARRVLVCNTFCDEHSDTLCAKMYAPHIARLDGRHFYFFLDRYQLRISEQGVPIGVSRYERDTALRGQAPGHALPP